MAVWPAVVAGSPVPGVTFRLASGNQAPLTTWFRGSPGRLTVVGVVNRPTQAQSASEGKCHLHWRFSLVTIFVAGVIQSMHSLTAVSLEFYCFHINPKNLAIHGRNHQFLDAVKLRLRSFSPPQFVRCGFFQFSFVQGKVFAREGPDPFARGRF